jgi:hypothetical protein
MMKSRALFGKQCADAKKNSQPDKSLDQKEQEAYESDPF